MSKNKKDKDSGSSRDHIFDHTAGQTGEAGEQKALEEMRRFGILDLKDAMPEKLSGGELRRMAIARALMRSPKVLFADEPTGDLDDENTQLVFACFRKAAEEGAAVLIVSHEIDALNNADVAFRMDGGQLSTLS